VRRARATAPPRARAARNGLRSVAALRTHTLLLELNERAALRDALADW
jgi:hypothetical protein